MIRAGFDHSKLRDQFGLVAFEFTKNKQIKIIFSYAWDRDKIVQMPEMIHQMKNMVQWDRLYVNQFVGEHLIEDIRRFTPVSRLTTQKNIKDTKEMDRIIEMDKIEQVQLTFKLFKNDQIKYPQNPSKMMKLLMDQAETFSEHSTEAGAIDYYNEGTVPDALIRALIVSIFSIRNYLTHYISPAQVTQPGSKLTKKYKNITSEDLIWK